MMESSLAPREINLATEFSRYPGGRYKKMGPFSGEEFRDTKLIPALDEAVSTGDIVDVILDGATGYPASFLEEAFGGLIRLRRYPIDEIKRHLRIRVIDPRYSVFRDLAYRYLSEAASRE